MLGTKDGGRLTMSYLEPSRESIQGSDTGGLPPRWTATQVPMLFDAYFLRNWGFSEISY